MLVVAALLLIVPCCADAANTATPKPRATPTPSPTAAITGNIFTTGNCSAAVTAYPKNGNGDIAPRAQLRTELGFPAAIAHDSNGKIYVANICGKGAGIGAGFPANDGTINIYAAGSRGNAAPVAVIGGPNTGLTDIAGVAVDLRGYIYVSNEDPDSIRIFAPGSEGNITPAATISGPNTGLNFPAGIFVDSNGKIYVGNSGSVLVYADDSHGNSAPVAAISGAKTGLADPLGVAVDSSGNIYVANDPLSSSGESSIVVFRAGSNGDVSPRARITDSNSGLATLGGIALDQDRNIYVPNIEYPAGCSSCLGNSRVTVYAAGSNGNVSPAATISGSKTGLRNPTGVTVDSRGNIYVSNFYGGGGQHGSVTIYAAGSNGNLSPSAIIANPDVGLTGPTGIALDLSGNIYVANIPPWASSSASIPASSTGASITVYPAGSVAGGAPIAKISGPSTMLTFPLGVAVDRSRKIYVVNDYHPYIRNSDYSITVYKAGSSGDAAPEAIISGSNTGLFNPQAISADSEEEIYVANVDPDTVTVYRAGSNGNVTPGATITNACNSGTIQAIGVDSKRNIYVTCLAPDAVNVFAAGSKGNVEPIATISGESGGIAVDSSGDIYVADRFAIEVFAPGSKGNVAPIRTIGGPHTPIALIGESIAVQ